jgi:competence protein ComEA
MDDDPGAFRRLLGTATPNRRKLGFGAVVVVVLVALAVLVAVAALTGVGRSATVSLVATPGPVPPSSEPRPAVSAGPVAFVHVLGAVRSPGLYRLTAGARVVDAVAAAGGLAEDADLDALNLARPITDGEQLRVPRIGEPPVAAAPGPSGADAPARVDLNTATAEQLDALPRIGPAIAARIVEWREQNGAFASADDLLQVSGIGDATVDGLRDLVLP